MSLKILISLCTLAVCLWITTMAAAQLVSAPEPQTGTIVGTVVDVTGAVVPGANVVLEGPVPEGRRTLATADNGFFKFDGVGAAKPYRILVSSKGLANWTSNDIVLKPGQYFILTGIHLKIASVQMALTVVPAEQVAREEVRAEEQQRIAGVIPNFYIVYDQNAVPLTPKLKFHLATKFLTDPITNTGFLLNAAIYQMTGYPSYREGARGYGQRLGATFAGGYTNILVGDGILPSLLHQDPRYFYQGTGTTKSRLLHALSSAFVIRGDDGHHEINFSDIGGDLASGAIANAYYPSQDRGAGLVVRNTLIGAGGRMVNAVLQEFLLHKLTSKHTTDAH